MGRLFSHANFSKRAASMLSLALAVTLTAGVWTGNMGADASNGYPQGFETTYRQGVLDYRQGDYSQALSRLQQAEALSPGHVNTQYYLAIVLDKLARGQEAAKYYALVSEFGTENRITDYARQRLRYLKVAMNMPDNHTVVAKNVNTLDDDESTMAVAIPMMGQQNALMVNASINNEVTGTFIVDTGATYTSISSEMARQLKGQLRTIGHVRITTANGQIEVPKVLIKEVNINGIVARNVEATIIDLHKGGKFDGLLGLSFIRNFQLTIDPKANRLVFRTV